MLCTFCEEKLLQPEMPPGFLVTLPSDEVAHKACAKQAWVSRKMFGSIKLDKIPEDELYELKHLLLNELNTREALNKNTDSVKAFKYQLK